MTIFEAFIVSLGLETATGKRMKKRSSQSYLFRLEVRAVLKGAGDKKEETEAHIGSAA